jgi:hypothetical protein
MTTTQIRLGGRARDLDSRKSQEDVINCYLESDDEGDFKRLTRAPAFRLLASVGNGPIRGMLNASNVLYVVSGNEFYKVTISPFGALNSTLIGTISGQNGPVSLAAIGTDLPQIMALTSGTGYIYNSDTLAFTEITDVSFTPDYAVTSFNQRFYLNKPSSNEFFGSDILDGLNYDPLFFASAENNPDPLVTLQSLNTEVVLFGTQSIERWQDIGVDTGFPLRRIQGATINRGCAAPKSLAQWENTLFWLADDFTVRSLNSNGMDKISDLPLEKAMIGYNFPSQAIGWFVDYPFYKCYCISFPGNNVTWCYDVLRRIWHKRDSVGVDCWRIGSSANYSNLVLLGDRFNGNIYAMDANLYTENNVQTPMTWVTPATFVNEAPMVCTRLEIIADSGVGPITNVTDIGQILNEPVKPYIRCAMSKDGGFTWTWLPDRQLGQRGDRAHRVVWRSLGRIKKTGDLVFKFESNGNWPVNIYSAVADMEAGLV